MAARRRARPRPGPGPGPAPAAVASAGRGGPAASSAVSFPGAVAVSWTTVTGRPANPAGGFRPASRHWLPDRKKIPVTPGWLQAPASSGAPAEPNATAVRPVSPQDRPAGLAASAFVVTSGLQPVPPRPDSCTPAPVSASSRSSGPAASADAAAASPAGSSPGAQCRPPSRLLARGRRSGPGWARTRPPGRAPWRRSRGRGDQAAVVGHARRGGQPPRLAGRGADEKLPEVVVRGAGPANLDHRPGRAVAGRQRGQHRRPGRGRRRGGALPGPGAASAGRRHQRQRRQTSHPHDHGGFSARGAPGSDAPRCS